MKKTIKTISEDETMTLSERLARTLIGGELIQLVGDLGAGKTTFVRGLAKGLESQDHVSSPTFTICNTYEGRLRLRHCDFYRLQDDQLIQEELDELIDDQSVIVLEWAENLTRFPIKDFISIHITTESENSRIFVIDIPEVYGYITL